MTFQEFLNRAETLACKDARAWAANLTFEEVYATCQRGDWLCWLFFRTNQDDLQALTLVKGLQANEVRHLMRDPRSIAAVDAAIAFGGGEINKEQLNAAAATAAAAAYADAYAYAYADAYAAAAAAAYAAAAAAAATAAYAADAYAAADAAADADADAADTAYAAKQASLSRSADIFRENIPYEKINRVWETM